MVRTFLRPVVQSCVVFTLLSLLASLSAFGQGSNPFFTPPTFSGNGQALSADVNGDGKPDLLFFDGTVLLGKGDGKFTTGTPWRSTAGVPNIGGTQFAIADFNGDGKADIFVIGPLNVLGVLLGNGDGTFQAETTTSVADFPAAFLVGDLNGDGKPDVLAQVDSSTLTYIGNGDGTFAAGIASNTASPEVANAFADFNGDGKLDLLVPGAGIQLGKGDGTFQAIVTFPAGALGGSNVVGDFDGDGKLDVIVTAANSSGLQLQVLFGNGDGTFRAGSIQSLPASAGLGDLVATDLNGDGKLDLIGSTGSAAQVFIGKGDGTFTPGNSYNAPTILPVTSILGSTSIVVADFNGDKKKDIAAFNTMLLGNGDGTLQGNPAVPGQFGFNAMGDFNGDGHPDFASMGPALQSSTNASVYQANLSIWMNDGKNNFTVSHTYTINIPSPNLADLIANVGVGYAADLNGDGKIDLVGFVWDAGGLNMIALLGNGDGSFGAPIPTRVNSDSNRLISLAFTLGDVNGDRKPDLLVNAGTGADNQGTLSIFLGKGDGTFGPANTPFVGGAIGMAVVGDFNNDNKADVITGSANGVGVLLGNGDGTFQPTTFLSNTGCATTCGTPVSADFNGDGNLDLMLRALGGGYQVLLGKGDGTFDMSPVVAVTPGTFSGFFQVADFNGDGKLDVLANGSFDPTLGLILGNGDGTFGPPLPVTNAGWAFVADFNGDKKPDILEVGANQLVWLYNIGQAAVTPPPVAPPDFSLGSGSGGGTATVAAGSTATYPLSLAGSGGFTGTVSLTCSVAPAGPTCSISPSSLMVTGSTTATATVSVTTTARSGVLPISGSNQRDSFRRIFWIFGALLAAASLIRSLATAQMRPRRFSWSLATAFGTILLLAATVIGGCGGGSSPSTGPKPSGGTTAGNYTVTVTAQSGSVSHQTKLTLTVQ
jgi:FG-GAP-like repeat